MSGYIGTQPVPQATQHRETFTATDSQTSFATAGYTPQFLDVFLNGIHLLNPEDYTASNGSDVVLTTGAALDDVLEVISYSPFEVADQTFTGDTSTDNLSVTGSFTSKGIDDNATSTAMTLDASGNLLVGQTTANAAVVGASIRSDGEIVATCSGAASGSFNRLGEGATVDVKKDGVIVGSLASDVMDFLVIGQDETGLGFVHDAVDSGSPRIIPRRVGSAASSNGLVDLGDTGSKFKDLYLSGDVYLDGREQFNLKNHGDIGVGEDYNTISLANSVLYQNTVPTNNAHSNNGLALYLSSYGMGGTHDDATNERAVQIYAGDTYDSGLYFRVRQGTNGWHRWKNLQSDWAALSGPASYYGPYESNWSTASGNGLSMSASTSNRGITIAESGYYQCQAWQRSAGTDFFIGIALSGIRTALESRSDGVWGHDHTASANSWSHSTYTGYLNAGERVTSGSSSTGGSYGTLGFSGGLLIVRLS